MPLEIPSPIFKGARTIDIFSLCGCVNLFGRTISIHNKGVMNKLQEVNEQKDSEIVMSSGRIYGQLITIVLYSLRQSILAIM